MNTVILLIQMLTAQYDAENLLTTTKMHLPDGSVCSVTLYTDYISVYQHKPGGLCFWINGQRKNNILTQYDGTATATYKVNENRLVSVEIKSCNPTIILHE